MKACDTGKFTLYGDDYNTKDGSALRDYIHVREICHALKTSVEHASCVPGSEIQPLYEYLGHGRLYSVKECIDAFKKVNGLDFKVVVNPRREGDLESAKHVDFDDISPYMPAMTATLYEMMKT
jgi:UDP-glucose 4-epimerase